MFGGVYKHLFLSLSCACFSLLYFLHYIIYMVAKSTGNVDYKKRKLTIFQCKRTINSQTGICKNHQLFFKPDKYSKAAPKLTAEFVKTNQRCSHVANFSRCAGLLRRQLTDKNCVSKSDMLAVATSMTFVLGYKIIPQKTSER